MSQPKAGAPAALISGCELSLMTDAAPTLIGNIAKRVVEQAGNFIRSVQTDETVREQTVGETWQRAQAVACLLEREGIGAGYQVILLQRDILQYVPAFWACLQAGATAVPLSSVAATLPADELINVLGRLDRPAILCDGPSTIVDRVAALLPDAPVLSVDEMSASGKPGPQAEASIPCLIPTSGSTGRVKLVAFETNAWLYRMCSRNYSALGRDADCLGVFPFDSLNGYRAVFLNYTSFTQLPSRMLMSRPLMVLEVVDRFKATNFQTTNTMAASLARLDSSQMHKLDLSSLEQVGLGGEAVTLASATIFRDLLVSRGAPSSVVAAGYGTTETGVLLVGADPTIAPLDAAGAIKLGGCIAGTTIRIVDDHGIIVSEGDVGHVEVSAPQMMFAGYWGEPDATRECFTPDGWWKTGDLGTIGEGSFAFRGRAKQTIVVGARKLSLVDIDAHLEQGQDRHYRAISFTIREPDDSTDRLGIAILADTPDFPVDDMIATMQGSIARRYGVAPTFITLPSADLPMTATGKVDRARLATLARCEILISGRTTEGSRLEDALDYEVDVAAAWREVFGREVDRNVDFFDAGGDSFSLVQLELEWSRRFGRQVPDGTFLQRATIETMAAMLAGTAPAAAEVTDSPAEFIASFKKKQRQLLSDWEGQRVTAEGLVIGRDIGSAVQNAPWPATVEWFRRHVQRRKRFSPSFWILQDASEIRRLFDQLDGMQIFGLRSGHLFVDYNGTHFAEMIALYVEEIRRVQARGPYILGGMCQGAVVAVAIARSLQRIGEEVALLTIVEHDVALAFRGERYVGDVALIFGRRSRFNPYRRFSALDRAWRRFIPEGAWLKIVDTDHDMFNTQYKLEVSRAITDAYQWAHRRDPRRAVPEAIRVPGNDAVGHAMTITMDPAFTAACGETRSIKITVENQSPMDWGATEESGIMVANHWLDDHGRIIAWHDGEADLPATLSSGGSVELTLEVTIPSKPGQYLLEVDLVEQGISWFKDHGDVQLSGYARVLAHASDKT